MKKRVKIVIDCLGGDYAPYEIVKGGVLSAREGNSVILVGREEEIYPLLKKFGEEKNPNIEVYDAREKVEMDEQPSSVLKKKNSSLYVGAKLVREGVGDGLVSAGNTGAVLTVGKFIIGTEEGIERPSIGVALPNPKGRTFLLDLGANVDVKPKHLVQFAIIGHTYAKEIMGIEKPRVGILSIGEEEGKGNELVRETYPLLKETKINFLGNAEGRDIYNGKFDVIVCDGFVGNVILKASESLGFAIVEMIMDEVKKSFITKLGALLIKPAVKRFLKKADFSEYGGIPLLGAKKPVIITHGRANAKAIRNAVRVAVEFLRIDINRILVDNIKKLSPGEVRVGD